MPDISEEEIRRRLEAESLAYEPPEDLAARTLGKARETGRGGLFGRFRSRSATRGLVPRKTPRWVLAGAGIGILALFYAVGFQVPPELSDTAATPPNGTGDDSKGRDLAFSGSPESKKQIAPDAMCEGGNCGGQLGAGGGAVPGAAAGSSGAAVPGPAQAQVQPQLAERQGADGDLPSGVSRSSPIRLPGPLPGPGFGNGQSIVRNGDMEVKIKKGTFSRNWARATAIATKHGGFVAGSSADQVKGQLSRGTIVVRIPSNELDAAVIEFQRLGKVVRMSTSSSDVSGQIVDFDARLRAAQARELQLLELLKQAKSVSDSLQVGTSLSEVRTEIESLQAQRSSIQNQVDLSTLTVSIYEPQAAPEDPRPIAKGALGQAWNKAIDSAELTASSIVIGAGRLLPLALLGLIIWAAVRFRRRKTLS
ncbi:MAG: DUF4349 domain-containing protein [Actinomycetota bacterium]